MNRISWGWVAEFARKVYTIFYLYTICVFIHIPLQYRVAVADSTRPAKPSSVWPSFAQPSMPSHTYYSIVVNSRDDSHSKYTCNSIHINLHTNQTKQQSAEAPPLSQIGSDNHYSFPVCHRATSCGSIAFKSATATGTVEPTPLAVNVKHITSDSVIWEQKPIPKIMSV